MKKGWFLKTFKIGNFQKYSFPFKNIHFFTLQVFYENFGQNLQFFRKKTRKIKYFSGARELRLDQGETWVQDSKFNFIIRLIKILNLKLYRRLELGRNLEFWQLKDRFQAGSTVCVLCSATGGFNTRDHFQKSGLLM